MRKHFLTKILPTVFLGGILAFAISIGNMYYGGLNNNQLYAGTVEDPENTGADVSGMFNERGYFKSNSVSVDENEIISDFNGNLMYTFPMFNMKGPGDLFLDFNLTYNGTMNYTVITADSNNNFQGSLTKYNLSAPGWVFSLNGMGVQMLNFETNFFTRKDIPSQTEIENNDVHMLVSGYHITDRIESFSATEKDKIMILRGDGSVLTLERFDGPSSGVNNEGKFIGEYYSDNRGEYTRAVVRYTEDAGVLPQYRNREVHVMQGDGLTYVYREHKNKYSDLNHEYPNYYLKPQVLLLTEVRDRFGHSITLQYTENVGGKTIYGRPLLEKISGPWVGGSVSLNYITTPSGAVYVTGAGNTFTVKADAFKFDPNENLHRGFVSEIVNNNDDNKIIINSGVSGAYTREGEDLTYNNNPSSNVDISVNLKRIVKLENYNGGVRFYEYLGNPTETALMTPANQKKIMVNGGASILNTKYFGQGRDVFFNNMLSKKITQDNNDDTLKIDTFNYKFSTSRSYDSGENPWSEYPVDSGDDYFSVVETTPGTAGNQFESPGKFGVQRKYKNFVVGLTQIGENNPDFEGHTKILRELHYNTDTTNFFKKVEYFAVNSHASSFLDTAVVETLDGIENKVRFNYQHDTYPMQTDTYLNPVVKKTEFDPLSQKTETFYRIFSDTSVHYRWGQYKVGGPQTYDTTFFYLLNQPDSMMVYSPQDSLIGKQKTEYILSNGILNPGVSDSGYLGQVKNQKVFAGPSFNVFKETKFKYFMNDTLGAYNFQDKPSNEGKLKVTIDPRGKETNFYYHLIGNEPGLGGEFDEPGQPGITYYFIKENGSIDSVVGQFWKDNRMPSITVSNPNSQVKLYDFKKYDQEGKLLQQFSNDKYLTSYSFDALDRIDNAILSYDFGTEGIVWDTLRDTIESYVYFTTQASNWGVKNYLTSGLDVYDTDAETFYMNKSDDGIEELDDYRIPMIKFKDEFIDSLNHMDSLEAVYLEFHPPYFTRVVNGIDPSTNYEFYFAPIRDIAFSSGNLTFNKGNNFEIPIVADSTGDFGCNGIEALYDSSAFYNYVDVTSSVKSFLESGDMEGFLFDASPSAQLSFNFAVNIGQCLDNGISHTKWKNLYSPRLHVIGKYVRIDSAIVPRFSGHTLDYVYHDQGDSIEILTKMSTGRSKKTIHNFDGFYRIKKSKLINDINTHSFDSTQLFYNFMDAQAKTIDGRNNKTEMSFDKWMNVKKTLNADSSFTLDTITYQNGLTYHWGSIAGLVSRQRFTDEEGNNFEKFFDAVGNLRREMKFIEVSSGGPPVTDSLITDYRYDSLYRVTDVKTPNTKIISYEYDGFGRQIERTTVDAGTEQFRHDKNDNLRFSMDAVQSTPNDFTFNGYDGINRLLYTGIGNLTFESTRYDWTDLNPDTSYSFENYATDSSRFLTVNVYDTLSTSIASGLFSPPSDYYNQNNLTSGRLVATAYRTRTTDNWSFKYYRYDARGRVIKMWNVLTGIDLGTKTVEYQYNSDNSIAFTSYQYGVSGEFKKLKYDYDDAGRLASINIYHPNDPANDSTDVLGTYKSFSAFTYDQNSMIDTLKHNEDNYKTKYSYNSRNWLTVINDMIPSNQFNEVLTYFDNGNVKTMHIGGNYSDNMTDAGNIDMTFSYDKSNRLLIADGSFGSKDMYDVENTYDKDGNLLTLKRDDASGSIADDYNYSYYSGTNKLSKVTGGNDQFIYDANGNLTQDDLSALWNIKYDHRNLMIEFSHTIGQNGGSTKLWYDDAGNRIRKVTLIYVGGGGGVPNWDSLEYYPSYNPEEEGGGGWNVMIDERYVRDILGNEFTNYDATSLRQWQIGTEGLIKADGEKLFYLKDHLGTTRAIIDTSNTVIQAVDFDMWGYTLSSRQYQTFDKSDYLFTGKERDIESSGYDYFGSRYYNSRIGRWNNVEPLVNKFVNWSPYQYGLCNPAIVIDVDGEDVIVALTGIELIKGGSIINPKDYSQDNDIGAIRFLDNVQNFVNENDIKDVDIRGYYSSYMGHELSNAVKFIKENLDNENEKVYIYGYSMGGNNSVELVEMLQDEGINVEILFTVDAYTPFKNEYQIPSNVKTNKNYYQKKISSPFGAHGGKNYAESGLETTIFNNLINDENVDHYNIERYSEKEIVEALRKKLNK